MKVPFKKSKYAGMELEDCPPEYLMWIVETVDTKDPKYGRNNQKLVDAANAAINAQTDRKPSYSKPASAFIPKQSLSYAPVEGPRQNSADELIQELKMQITALYDDVMAIQSLIDVYTEKNGIIKHSEHLPR